MIFCDITTYNAVICSIVNAVIYVDLFFISKKTKKKMEWLFGKKEVDGSNVDIMSSKGAKLNKLKEYEKKSDRH